MLTSEITEQVPDAQLWQSVCQGNVPAFEVVVRRYQSLVCAVAYSACGDLAVSEDVAQEAFLSAWRQRASLAEPSRLGAWLCGIARNLGHNARRRTGAAATVPLEAAETVPSREPDPVENAVSREEEALVWQALQTIPESYREPLVLFYREQQSVAEVATALDLSADAVKQRLSRGRGMLHERVAQLVEGALRRSRPGRPFTLAVMTGLAAVSAGTKTALAAGAVQAASPLAKAAATGVAGSMAGSLLGSLAGLLGGWFGFWLPAQLAPTKPEREHLSRGGRRFFLVGLLFAVLLAIPIVAVVRGLLSMPAYLAALGAWFVAFWSYLAVEMILMVRTQKRLRAQAAQAEPNDAPLRLGLNAVAARYRGRVFRSRASFLGLPLLDVNVADPAPAGMHSPGRVARGWIAIGDDAYGVLFALGGRLAVGLIAFGGRALGLIAVGGAALGGFAFGGLAAGLVVFAGLGLGWQVCGGGAVAWDTACGGSAVAWHTAVGGLAIAHDQASGGAAWAQQVNPLVADPQDMSAELPAGFRWVIAHPVWYCLDIILAVLLLCALRLLLMYQLGERRDESGN